MTSHSKDFSSNSFTSPGASPSWRGECSCSPSSRDGACSSPIMGEASRRNYSSSSLTGYGHCCTYPRVSVNKRLLAPLDLSVDPALQEIRTKEKDEIKMLNNQFAALIGKVQSLEQHNQVLLTRWNFLRDQDNSLSDLDIKLLYDRYMNKLNLEIRSIDVEKEHLDSELEEVLVAMDAFRNNYEDEINKRTGMEFTFTTLKKDLDNGFLHKTELEAKLSGLHAWVELMKTIHDQELEEAMSQIKDVSLVLGIDNNRYNPDPHRIVEDVRAQYEAMAIRNWEELEALTRSKLNEREVLSAKYGDHLLNDRRVIAELNIKIQKIRSCIVSLKSQCLRLEDNIKDVGLQGETALNDAKAKLGKLEEALHSARQDLAQLIKEYQELMNIKLALDIEILTYRKLVEGEEISMESPSPAFISKIYSTSKPFLSDSSIASVPDMASRAKENQSGGNKVASSGGFVKSHNRSGVTPDDSFSASHSCGSEGISEAFKSPSSSHRDNLGSSFRSSSNRSGNFADIEDTMESNASRSHSHWSGRSHSNRSDGNLESNRHPSGGNRDISEGSLSRSQSNGSEGLTESIVLARIHSGASDSNQEGNHSGSPSHSHAEFPRTQSGVSTRSSETRYYNSRNESVPDGQTGSQGNINRELTDSVFVRSQSDDVSEGSLFRSYSGTSTSYREGGLSRSQSDANECGDVHGNEDYVEPFVSGTTTAEDGGVPVGGISRTHSETSRDISEARSQSDANECGDVHGNEDYVEPFVSGTTTAEDGGVPVGGISRTHSETSRDISETRSQSDANECGDVHGNEDYVEPFVSGTTTAEDGGVPVGGISRTHSETSRDISEAKSQSDEDECRNTHGNEGYAEPIVSGPTTAEDGGVPVGGVFTTNSEASRVSSEGSLPRRQSDDNKCYGSYGTQRYDGPIVSWTTSAEDGGVPVGGIFRTHSEASREISEDSLPRSPALTDSVFIRSSSSADEDVCEESILDIQSGDRESALKTSFPGEPSPRCEGLSTSDLSKSPTTETRDVPDNYSPHKDRSRSECGFSRNYNRREGLAVSVFARTQSDPNKSGHSSSQSDRSEGFVKAVVSKINRSILEGGSSKSQTSKRGGTIDIDVMTDENKESKISQGDTSKCFLDYGDKNASESGGPVETSTPIQLDRGNEEATEHSLSRSHSGESGSFKAADFNRSSSEDNKVISEGNISKSYSKQDEQFTEDVVSRSYSYRCAVMSHPNVSKTENSEAEDVPESGLHRSPNSESGRLSPAGSYRSQSGEKGNESEVDLSRSCSETAEEAAVSHPSISHDSRNE